MAPECTDCNQPSCDTNGVVVRDDGELRCDDCVYSQTLVKPTNTNSDTGRQDDDKQDTEADSDTSDQSKVVLSEVLSYVR